MKTIQKLAKKIIKKIANTKLFDIIFSHIFDLVLRKQKLLTPDINNAILLNELHKIEPFTFISNPGNCGDLIILKATIDFFNRNKIRYEFWNGESKFDNIVYSGGGIWVPNYKETWIKKIIPIFSHAKKILILPSSFNCCPELIKILDERFIIFCREEMSYKYMQRESVKSKIILDHDMAFRIEKNILTEPCCPMTKKMKKALYNIMKNQKLSKEIYVIRKDSESKSAIEGDFDISGMYESNFPTPDDAIFGTKIMFSTLAIYDKINTDRLHVAIAAALLGKQVNMKDNNYGKLSAVYKHSMQKYKNVSFIK